MSFPDTDTAEEIDRKLRWLARVRAGWEDLMAWLAATVRRSGAFRLLGFESIGQYAEERPGLPARAFAQRVRLEERRCDSPALRAASARGLSYEKPRLLARLPEKDLGPWVDRAEALTVAALRRELQAESERKMRAARKLRVPLPLRVAAVLAAAVKAVRERTRRPFSIGRCLAIVALHFVDTWNALVPRRRTRAKKVLVRDHGFCCVPGCSHPATQSHHVAFRSHGGGDELASQVGLCAFHHLECIHEGPLSVVGEAPDRLRWFLRGAPFDGRPAPLPA